MDEEIGNRVLQQAMNIWILPEIEKRKKEGWLKENFVLKRAIIIFNPRGITRIRFNEKVDLIAEAKINRTINAGEIVYERDIEKINKIIPKNLPKDCGWLVIIFINQRVIVAFNFLYNLDKIQEFLKASKEFYESAIDNLDKNRLRPFFEECWAVAELLSACNFLSLGQEYDSHHVNIKKMKNWVDLGNVEIKFSEILQRLNRSRKIARYLHPGNLKKENPKGIIEILKEMVDFTEERFKPK